MSDEKLTGAALEQAIRACPPDLRRQHTRGWTECEATKCAVRLKTGRLCLHHILCAYAGKV